MGFGQEHALGTVTPTPTTASGEHKVPNEGFFFGEWSVQFPQLLQSKVMEGEYAVFIQEMNSYRRMGRVVALVAGIAYACWIGLYPAVFYGLVSCNPSDNTTCLGVLYLYYAGLFVGVVSILCLAVWRHKQVCCLHIPQLHQTHTPRTYTYYTQRTLDLLSHLLFLLTRFYTATCATRSVCRSQQRLALSPSRFPLELV